MEELEEETLDEGMQETTNLDDDIDCLDLD